MPQWTYATAGTILPHVICEALPKTNAEPENGSLHGEFHTVSRWLIFPFHQAMLWYVQDSGSMPVFWGVYRVHQYVNTSTRLPTKFVLSVFHGERWCSDACATSLPHQNAASTTMSIPVDKHGGMGFHGQVLQSSQILILLLSICFFRVFMSHT